MRCDCCPLSDPEDACPESEGKYGLEHKDGMSGCSHPWNWIKKRDDMHTEAIGEMGLDMGIEMSLSPDELARAIEICEHMVGLDYKRPYHRHGKAYYQAYRNFYADVPEGNKILDKLPKELLVVHRNELGATYYLTQVGFDWLGRQLHITITRR